MGPPGDPIGRTLLISLGGTIAMTGADGRAVAPTLDGSDLVRSLPGLERPELVETVGFGRKPSVHLTFSELIELARSIEERLGRGDLSGVVITQGTDTIEESAFALDLLLDPVRPVVVTGAMRNPDSAGADGPANLLAAIALARDPAARGCGVMVVLNDEIHAAGLVRKGHTSNPAAFGSGPGMLGLVTEGRAWLATRPTRRAGLPQPPWEEDESRVALIEAALDDDGRLLAGLPDLGYRGAVIQGMGGGHLPEGNAQAATDLLERMPVVLASRTGAGVTLSGTYDFPGSEMDLLRRGLLPAGWLDGPKARVLLTLLLRTGVPRPRLERRFLAIARGEGGPLEDEDSPDETTPKTGGPEASA